MLCAAVVIGTLKVKLKMNWLDAHTKGRDYGPKYLIVVLSNFSGHWQNILSDIYKH